VHLIELALEELALAGILLGIVLGPEHSFVVQDPQIHLEA